jgi:hypothetical protein
MRFWVSANMAFLLFAAGSSPAPAQTDLKQSPRPRRANELTLAGLRPGRDHAATAIRLYGKPDARSPDQQSLGWVFEVNDGALYLNLDVDKADVVQFIRVSHGRSPTGAILAKHGSNFPHAWHTGRGLANDALASRVVELYGEPDSRSPSTKDGQQLELLYYAFDWAGTAVPQVMEVLCTVARDGKPGRVVEITLAAPSL